MEKFWFKQSRQTKDWANTCKHVHFHQLVQCLGCFRCTAQTQQSQPMHMHFNIRLEFPNV